MQAVKAYYNEGIFIPFQPLNLPKGSQVIVTILDFPIKQVISEKEEPLAEPVNSLPHTQQAALDFLAAIESIKEEDFTDEDREAFAAWDRGEFRVNFEERLS